jgi:dTDP-4-amino-4,6-dideoxygalactose transaminase
MLVSKNSDLIDKAKKVKAFYYDKNVGDRKIPGLYDIIGFGLNLRMSEIAAALGNAQLKRVSEFILKRKNNTEELANYIGQTKYGSLLPISQTGSDSSYYCASFVLEPQYVENRNIVAASMNALGIGTSIYYPIALPESTFYSSNPSISRTISSQNATRLANANIAIGVGPHLDSNDMVYVAEKLIEVLEKVLR